MALNGVNELVACCQYDQIGRFLKVFEDKVPCKSSPNIRHF